MEKKGICCLVIQKMLNQKNCLYYVDSVTLKKNGVVIWDSLHSDSRVLVAPGTSIQLAAAIVTKDPDATFQTMTLDIGLKYNHPYKLSMYFLDWDKENRRSVIEIFDLQTLNIIAPVAMVRDYEHGKYVSFSFDKSVRIRN